MVSMDSWGFLPEKFNQRSTNSTHRGVYIPDLCGYISNKEKKEKKDPVAILQVVADNLLELQLVSRL